MNRTLDKTEVPGHHPISTPIRCVLDVGFDPSVQVFDWRGILQLRMGINIYNLGR